MLLLSIVRSHMVRATSHTTAVFTSRIMRGWLFAASIVIMFQPISLQADPSAKPVPLDTVRGQSCYSYGDNETPAQAKNASAALAQEQAVRSYRIYVQATATVKNLRLEEDLIQSASAAVLQDVTIEKQEQKGREICTILTAKISPVKMEDLIQQQTKAKQVAQAAQASLLSAGASFGLKVWTNKDDGRYVEGDPLIILVQSDQDAYLKLDYFQADGTVVHLVPNIYGGESFVRAGRIYTFGGPESPSAFRITGPFGSEAIKAIASTHPFDQALAPSRNVEESRQYLSGLQEGLRGVQVQSGKTAWAEASVNVITTSKAVREHNAPLSGMRGARLPAEPPSPSKPTSITGSVGNQPTEPASRP